MADYHDYVLSVVIVRRNDLPGGLLNSVKSIIAPTNATPRTLSHR